MTDARVPLAVICLLGALAIMGTLGVIYLLAVHVDPAGVAVVAGITGNATGALGAVLASTRSGPPAAKE